MEFGRVVKLPGEPVTESLEELLNVEGQPEVQAQLKADMEAIRKNMRAPLPDVIIYD